MNNILEDKVVILTGSGGGIGSAIAEKLAQKKMKIVLFGGNNVEKLQRTKEKVQLYSSSLMLPGNLTDLDFMTSAIETVLSTFGKIDILINNAGLAQSTPFEEITEKEFDLLMDINVRTPFFLTQKVIPFLKKSDHGTIINIASVVSHAGYPLQSVYSASKHALLGLTKSIAREYYKENIRVHTICPGGVYTDMVKVSRPDLTPEGMILPEEIADILCFLLENRGNAVIDEILVHRGNKEPFLV